VVRYSSFNSSSCSSLKGESRNGGFIPASSPLF
jgi:hypothetical protein